MIISQTSICSADA